MQVKLHKDKKPGDVLQFHKADDLKLVATTGAHINVVRREDGSLVRPSKPLSKKHRRKLRKAGGA